MLQNVPVGIIQVQHHSLFKISPFPLVSWYISTSADKDQQFDSGLRESITFVLRTNIICLTEYSELSQCVRFQKLQQQTLKQRKN